MENKKRMPATVLAQMEVFDYLKEKVGERKTRTEAYCDLLDKAMAGFVSSYLRRQDYELRPCQCHVTVSDLAVEWRWHRATVRSFLDTLESFGLLTRIRLPKSVVITMAVQSGQPAPADDVQSVSGLAAQLREVLSDWVVGYADSSATGSACGQLVRSAMTASGVRVDPDKASKDDDPLAVPKRTGRPQSRTQRKRASNRSASPFWRLRHTYWRRRIDPKAGNGVCITPTIRPCSGQAFCRL